MSSRSATVPVAVRRVPRRTPLFPCNGLFRLRLFGGTPNKARETHALLKALRLQ